jgi:preprotein translocase subunit YajC
LSILQLQWLAQNSGISSTQPLEPIPWYANPQDMVLVLLVAVFAYFIFASSRTKKKEQQQRDDMLKNLKRGDRVITAGGILGAVVDVRDSEVMLKVDESSNAKIKFTRDAIKRVLTEDETSSPAK